MTTMKPEGVVKSKFMEEISESFMGVKNFYVLFVALGSCFMYKGLTSGLFYLIFRLLFGTLYPAYASYKAVRTKNVKEYVKWMMYWIVFALFSCAETFTDVFLSWFPFYYEIKIILVLWLLSPATKGSSILYRKFVHPTLSKREQEIDEYISKAKEQGYHTVLNLGTKGVNYATNVIMQTAIKGGGGLVNQIRKSYSLSDLTETDRGGRHHLVDDGDETDDVVVTDPRLLRRRRSPKRSASGSPKMEMYFSEVDIRQRSGVGSLDHIRSTDDISSGYSSAEPLYGGQMRKTGSRESLVRSGSMNAGVVGRPRTRSTRSTVASTSKKGTSTEESGISEDEADSSEFDNVVVNVVKKTPSPIPTPKPIENSEPMQNETKRSSPPPPPLSKSSSEEGDDFFDSVEGTTSPIEQKVDNDVLLDSKDTVVTDTVSVVLNENTTTNDDAEKTNQTGNVVHDDEPVPQIVLIPSETFPENQKTCIENNNVNEIQESYNDQIAENEKEATEVKEIKETTFPSNKPEELMVKTDETNITKSASAEDLNVDTSSIAESTGSSDGGRGGKYRKKVAPPPPEFVKSKTPEPSQINPENQPIKATLVLKPGVVKPIESPTKSEVFVSRSPKPKHKELSPIAKLKLLPKKFNFWHKDPEPVLKPEPETTKRSSWHEENLALRRNNSGNLNREQSRSNEVLITQRQDNDGQEERVVGNLVLRQLSESPSRKKTSEKH